MHEVSILESLLGRVEAEARARGAVAVHRVQVRIGELSGVDAELLRSAYGLYQEQEPWRAAELVIDTVPASWACPRCRRSLARGALLRCPGCGVPARLLSGDEIVLERIELEVA